MTRQVKSDHRLARMRRDKALSRNELRAGTEARISPAGVTSAAIKAEDPETRRMIDEFMARRSA